MFQPTRFPLLDEPPQYSILDAARRIGDLSGITDAESSWVPGINLWWYHGGVNRWPHRRQFSAVATDSYFDDDIDTIADPAVWPTAVDVQQTGQTVYSAPDGVKDVADDPTQTRFRSFSVYAPLVELDLSQDVGEAADRAQQQMRAAAAGQIAYEFADSLYTKNPGLQRSAVDITGVGGAVHVTEAFSVLAEAYGVGYPTALLSSADGDHCITVPWHAVPFLLEANLADWQSGRLIDCYGRPVNTTPGLVLSGPITDPDDLETAVAPTAGNGWLYISPRPFVGVGRFDRLPTGHERAGRAPGHSGVHAYSNQAVGLAEGPAIVVFRPVRTYAINVSLNKALA